MVDGFNKLALASLRHYRGVHAMVVCGVAVAIAVLSGATVVGSSVRGSLRDLALSRLGNTRIVVSSNTPFREALAANTTMAGAAPLIALTGAVTNDRNRRTASRVAVFGVDERFYRFHGRSTAVAPHGRDLWMSEALARELEAATSDVVIVRVAKPSDIPLSTLQGRRENAGARLRFTLARVVGQDALGEFALTPTQGPSLAIFLPLERLQDALDLSGRINALLTPESVQSPEAVLQWFSSAAELDDYALRLRPAPDEKTLVIESRAGVIAPALERAIGASVDGGERVLVHLANTIRIRDHEIPYSLVAGRESTSTGVVLNQWAADDLSAKIGDPLTLEYYVWSDAAGLETRSADLMVGDIVPMTGDAIDRTFTPDYPGMTDAATVSSWDPPFPVDLDRVRKKDEHYWDQWRAAPKAFLPLGVAQSLWATAHGSVSSVRVGVPEGLDRAAFAGPLSRAVLRQIDPPVSGIDIRDARAAALLAAEGTTDFSAYFFYFSFFLVIAGLLLSSLFFALGVEQRTREIGILRATGYNSRDITRLLASEAAVLAGIGVVPGIAGGVAYAAIIMHGLRTWWSGAVGTTALTLHLDWPVLVGGAFAGLAASAVALAFALRVALRRSPRALLGGPGGATERAARATRSRIGVAAGMALIAVALMIAARLKLVSGAAGFFTAGGFFMIAGLVTFNWWLRRATASHDIASLPRFGAANAKWGPTRSVLSASLITSACFVIVSVGAFRRDPAGISIAPRSGTGGFTLMAESVAPLMHNPNLVAGREELALPSDPLLERMRVVRFRVKPGDETSCLTLYQPRNPRLVAPEDAFLTEGRFAFAKSLASTSEERANPWLLLRRRFEDGAIPAIADQTSLEYVFHLDVGGDYVFAPAGGAETRLRIVAALTDSVLQSELIIGERDFVQLFPRNEGYGMWMIEAAPSDAAALSTLLEDRLADFGLDVIDTRTRLAAYHRVENTYLSTFQALGGLGLIVGTFGLAAVLARNILERQRELALLRAVGFTPAHLRVLVLSESLLLVGIGVLLGTATALVAVLPALGERGSPIPVPSMTLLLTAVIGSAVVSAAIAARLATSSSILTALKGE